MAMQCHTRRLGRAIVVSLTGQPAAGGGPCRLRRLIERLGRLNRRYVILDLAGLRLLDCAGIGQLVEIHCAARRSGTCLVLVNLAPRQKRALEVAGLLQVLTVCGSVSEAVRWLTFPATRTHRVIAGLAQKEARHGVYDKSPQSGRSAGVRAVRAAGRW